MTTTDEATTAGADRASLIARARAAEAEGSLLSAIRDYTAAVRIEPDPEIERHLVGMRHDAFSQLDRTPGRTTWPPVYPDLFEGCTEPPELHVRELTAEKLGSAITHHGCLLVRGLLDPAQVAHFIADIDQALAAYSAALDGEPGDDDEVWCSFFEPNETYRQYDVAGGRHWLRPQGSMYTGDSPRALFDLLDFFESTGLHEVLTGYLGERPALSLKKGTLRRVPVTGGTSWHQDGAFMGEGIRSCNVWVTLTPCGGDTSAPGLEIIPRRFDTVCETGTHGAIFDWSVGDGLAEELAREAPVLRPYFAPGDALLFDDVFLHRTALDPGMDTERYALETWFFAPSSYPEEQLPIVF
jgi:hypothetical protein